MTPDARCLRQKVSRPWPDGSVWSTYRRRAATSSTPRPRSRPSTWSSPSTPPSPTSAAPRASPAGTCFPVDAVSGARDPPAPAPHRPAAGHPPTMRLTPRGRREKKEASARPLPLRRPGVGRDPYAVLRVLMDPVRWLSRNGRRRWIWVPACAGTTASTTSSAAPGSASPRPSLLPPPSQSPRASARSPSPSPDD